MGDPIYIVDAFAARPFAGNQAAVCFLEEFPEAASMQRLAAEMNLAETAFVVPRGGAFSLRWFTPAVEVELCGHATLASAHLLWETGRLTPDAEARFDTVYSGRLTCTRNGGWIEMDFPADPPTECEPPATLLEALGCEAVAVAKGKYDYLVEVASEDAVRSLDPDMRTLSGIPVRGVMATARGDADFDFVSRFFAPGSGIDEDPATGSAHCVLAPYWTPRIGKTGPLHAFQASQRGGTVRVELRGERVLLAGRAHTIVRGELA